MHSVTSGAVYQTLDALTYIKDLGGSTSYTSFLQIPKGMYCFSTSYYKDFTDRPSEAWGRAIFICGSSRIDSDEQVALLICARNGKMFLGHCYGGTPRYEWTQIV